MFIYIPLYLIVVAENVHGKAGEDASMSMRPEVVVETYYFCKLLTKCNCIWENGNSPLERSRPENLDFKRSTSAPIVQAGLRVKVGYAKRPDRTKMVCW